MLGKTLKIIKKTICRDHLFYDVIFKLEQTIKMGRESHVDHFLFIFLFNWSSNGSNQVEKVG